MKREIILLFMILLIVPSVLALDLTIEKTSLEETMIYEFQNPVGFELQVTNNGVAESINFYNLVGFLMEPSEKISLGEEETKEINLTLTPVGNFNQKGMYSFKYTIRGNNSSVDKTLAFKVVRLDEAFEIGSGEFDPESSSIKIYIKNKENFNFENIVGKFESPFFSFEESFALKSHEKREFDVPLNKEDFKKLMAGFYTLSCEIVTKDKKADLEGIMKFIEKDIIKTENENYGFIINTEIVRKINQGNTVYSSQTVLKKNIISRLFTTFSPEPNSVERDGFVVYYTWDADISPGEALEISVKTNWIFPLIIIVFLIVVVILAKQYTSRDLALKKKVSFVHTKKGDFALKVSIIVSARKEVDGITIVDRLPALMKVYEKFGQEQPTKVDEARKRIEWNFEKLEAGEKRLLSYFIYSKVGVVGKFVLPSAGALYSKDGKIKESQSNRAFFVAEQKSQRAEFED